MPAASSSPAAISGYILDSLPGLAAFREAFGASQTLVVGVDGIALDEFLTRPVEEWVKG